MRFSSALSAFFVFSAAWASAAEFHAGLQTHFAFGDRLPPLEGTLLPESGTTSIRDEFFWKKVERVRGQWSVPAGYADYVDSAVRNQIAPLITLDFSHDSYAMGTGPEAPTEEWLEAYARYCEFVVTANKGKVGLYEVWNEWDHRREINSPESYLRLLKKVYPRIKKIDPNATVIGGAVTYVGMRSGWLQRVIELGGLDYCDGVSIHPYVFVNPGRDGTPEAWLEWMQRYHADLTKAANGRKIDLYITELGWPTHDSGNAASRELAAAYLARTYMLARLFPSIKGVWWYDYLDDGWKADHHEKNYGIVQADGTPKPAFYAFQDVAPLTTQWRFEGRVATDDPHVWILKFSKDGEHTYAIWNTDANAERQLIFHNAALETQNVLVKQAGRTGLQVPWQALEWTPKPGILEFPPPGLSRDRFSIVVSGTPWFITGKLDGTKLTSIEKRPRRMEKPAGAAITPFVALATPAARNSDPFAQTDKTWGRLEAPSDRPLVSSGKAGDFEARASMSWDWRNLYILVEVTDDIHAQNETDNQLWKGDSLQIALQSLPNGGEFRPAGFTLFNIGTGTAGPRVYRERGQSPAPVGLTDAVSAKIERQGGKTIYKISIPHAETGASGISAGSAIGLSLAVNDNDGADRKNWIQWGGGITTQTGPADFGLVILKP